MFRAVLTLFLASVLTASGAEVWTFPGEWKHSSGTPIRPAEPGKIRIRQEFPGSVQVFVNPVRQEFRPNRSAFEKNRITVRVKAEGFHYPVKGWITVTDKDGTWFQSEKEFSLQPGEETLLSVRTDLPSRELLPSGHSAAWSGLFDSVIYSVGVSLCSDEKDSGILTVFRPEKNGSRSKIPLAFTNLQMPDSGKVLERTAVRFNLSEEFFNPWDPEEIAVDLEVQAPGKKEILKYPAFYGIDCLLNRHFSAETVRMTGLPFWEFRFLPMNPGEYRLRLTAKTGDGRTSATEWISFQALPKAGKGFVRVSKKNPRYFEFDNGRFFYPVGLNIHCNTDRRCEDAFGFGYLPDQGEEDYRIYFDACRKAGINLTEIWMAAWTYAIEWNADRAGYYGCGRYNLMNAWKLDRVLNMAAARGILVNLVLDNHGKLATSVDPEWTDSPFNTDHLFAKANGAVTKYAVEFWSHPVLRKYNRQRNRYIAARWGADPNIFAFEFWSEVDLVGGGRTAYDKGTMSKWHSEEATFLRSLLQGKNLISTHVCNDIGTAVWWRKVTMDLPELTHLCCDAYRSSSVAIADQMEYHKKKIGDLKKPAIVTEYGGSTGASGKQNQIADLHGGMWSSLFTRQAGIPMLWWHDLVHRLDLYQHYRGFNGFLEGLDLRDPNAKVGDAVCTRKPPKHYPEDPAFHKKMFPAAYQYFSPFSVPVRGKYWLFSDGTGFGWIFDGQKMHVYPSTPLGKLIPTQTVSCAVPTGKKETRYHVLIYDTLRGEVIRTETVRTGKDGMLRFALPPMVLDWAFKFFPAGGVR